MVFLSKPPVQKNNNDKELFFLFAYLLFLVSTDVGRAPKLRLGWVNARRRDPFVVWFLGETLQGLSLALLQILLHVGRMDYLLPEWR